MKYRRYKRINPKAILISISGIGMIPKRAALLGVKNENEDDGENLTQVLVSLPRQPQLLDF
jgi:hypothetical protein